MVENQSYLLATNDFMAAGGDQYTMFKSYPIANDYSSLEESVISYMQTVENVAAKVEGRINVKAALRLLPLYWYLNKLSFTRLSAVILWKIENAQHNLASFATIKRIN